MSQTRPTRDRPDRLRLEREMQAFADSPEFQGVVEPLHEQTCNDHFALLYEDRQEQFDAIVPFLEQGLQRGERCMYVLDDVTEEELLSTMREAGVDADAAVESGQLSFHTVEETYLEGGTFEPDEMVKRYADTVQQATGEYEALRIVAETTWLQGESTTVAEFMEYESKINRLFDQEDCIALCSYDRSAFAPEVIKKIIRTHPHLISDGAVCHNYYYTPPEEFFGPDDAAEEVERMLGTLVDRTEAKVAVQERQQFQRELYGITSDPDQEFEEKLQALFDLGCEWFDLECGGLARVDADADQFEVEYVSDGSAVPLTPGLELPLSETYCSGTTEVRDVMSIVDPETASHDDAAVYQEFGLRTYLGTYLALENGPNRTFFFVSSESRAEPFSEADHTFLELIGQWVQYELDRQQREQELELFRNLIDQSNDSVFVVEPETGRFLDINETAARRLGYDRDELLELSVIDIGEQFSGIADWRKEVEAIRARGSMTFEGAQKRKDGEVIPVEVNTSIVTLDREYLLGIARDISDRKRREQFLQQLYRITATADRSFAEKVQEMLGLGQEWFDLDVGYFATTDLEADQFEIRAAVGSHPRIQPGQSGSLSEAYCERVIDTGSSVGITDAASAGWTEEPCYDWLGLDTYLGTPLVVNGDFQGTLCFGSRTPRDSPFTEADYTFLELMSRWISYELERNERETELREVKERFQRIFEHSNDAIFINDPHDDEIVDVNPAGLELLGYDREELLSLGPSDCHPGELDEFQKFVDEVFEQGHGWTEELTCLPKDGAPIPAEISASPIELDDRNLMLAIVRDITERKKHESFQRELYEITADRDLPFDEKVTELLELGCERFGLDCGGLAELGQDGRFESSPVVCNKAKCVDQCAPRSQPEPGQFFRRTVEQETPLGAPDVRDLGWEDDPVYTEDGVASYFGVKITDGAGVYGTLWFGSRSPREQPFSESEATFMELLGQWVSHVLEQRRRESQLAALNATSRELMSAETPAKIAEVTVEHAHESLGLPLTAVLTYDRDAGRLVPAEQTPQAEDELPTATLCDGASGPAWNAFVEEEPRTVPADCAEDEFPDGDLTQIVTIPLAHQGVFVTATRATGGFAAIERDFIEATAATVEAAYTRADREQLVHERESALEEQNETLERLNRINTTIRNIDQALVQAATRGEIERVVCEQLADVGPYELAWIGSHDAVTDEITPNEWEGTDTGYLDTVRISAADEPEGLGPGGRTVRTRESQVVNDVLTDDSFEPWRQEALNRGYHSVVSLPLEYGDTLYGILVVYAGQPGVFDELEQAVLEEMADTIAYAINATESKKALVSDELTEIEFTIDMDTGLVELVRDTGCDLSLETLVPQSDGGLRAFFSIRGATADEVLATECRLPVTDLTLVSECTEGDEPASLFDATLNGDSLAETVLDHGGQLSQLDLTPEDATATVHLAADAAVREFVEMIRAKYANVELTAQRTHKRPQQTTQAFHSAVLEQLTARQLEVLQTAYFNGYFEEPRVRTASEVAESLDISQPTFNSHARAAQRKLLRQLFEEELLLA